MTRELGESLSVSYCSPSLPAAAGGRMRTWRMMMFCTLSS
jgi:hypothetical protein